MASSFRDSGLCSVVIRQFYRILRPGGVFVALWNPRLVEANPLAEIEAEITRLKPEVQRILSGRSRFTMTVKSEETDLMKS